MADNKQLDNLSPDQIDSIIQRHNQEHGIPPQAKDDPKSRNGENVRALLASVTTLKSQLPRLTNKK